MTKEKMMDSGKDLLEKSIFKGLEIVLEYERSLVRYFIVGNGAALVFILSFYRSSAIKKEVMQAFICPMWAFGIALVMSIAGFFLMYLYSRKSIGLSIKMYELASLIPPRDISDEQIKDRNQEIQDIQNSQKKITKTYRSIIYVALGIVAALFCYGLFSSLSNVSNFYA